MTRTLKISPELTLPAETVTSTVVVYGGKGMGKTNLGSVLMEEIAAAQMRFSVIDPMGVWWGLRHDRDGKGKGIEVLILGGTHGDIPIEPTGGAVVADLVVDETVNVVIDISRRPDGTMWAIGERIRFVRDYSKRLYQRQGERRRPLLQVYDEAARFSPQTIRKGEEEVAACMGAIAVLVEEGRNVGIGVCLITQRSARLNKDVAELADCMIAFRTVGPNSRRAVLDWLGEHVEKERLKELDAAVRTLKVGSALVVSPGWLEVEKVVRFRARQTFDSSKTPKAGEAEARVSGEGAKPDLAKYQARMAETIEKVKAEDPKELRKQLVEKDRQIRQLTADSGQRTAAAPAKAATTDVRPYERRIKQLVGALEQAMKFIIEVNAQDFFKAAGESVDREKIEQAITAVVGQATKMIEQDLEHRRVSFEKWRREGARILKSMSMLVEQEEIKVTVNVRHNEPFTVTPASQRPPRAVRASTPNEQADGTLPIGERKVLTAIAQHPDGVTREQLTVLTGYTKSSRNTYLQRLGARGYTDATGERILATDSGRAALGSDYELLPTGDELLEYWRAELPEGERKVLDAVVAAYPGAVDRDVISEQTGYTKSSRNTYLQRLGARRLVETTRDGVRAAAMLFEEL